MSEQMPDSMRGPMMRLYAAALDDSAEGALRFLAWRFDDWFGGDIEDAMQIDGWAFGSARGNRFAYRPDPPEEDQ